MQISQLLTLSGPAGLYKKGNASMWEDDHISRHLLSIHLSQETDMASRKRQTIEKTVSWIESYLLSGSADILDLGCGPGLYCEILASHGHRVTGVDFSLRSIEYARKTAEERDLPVEYIHQNYLTLSYENRFDLVMMIFCDFDVLVPAERSRLLEMIRKALKPGGLFIFDTLNQKAPAIICSQEKSWEVAETGFWSDEPYLALSETYHFETEQVILQQHIVGTESAIPAVYRFWTHYYGPGDLYEILGKSGFSRIETCDTILPADETRMDEGVTFYRAYRE